MGRRGQTRYRWFDRLNTETVAGIKDMNLGRVVWGEKRGNGVIRFDTGHRTGHQPHINFDPRGYPSHKNLHLYVPQSVVSAAYYFQKTAEVAGSIATVATVATDAYRLGSAVQQDYHAPSKDKLPVKSIHEASSIAGGYAGGYVGGSSGAYVGATTGATVGAILGPTGSLVGSVAGAIIGSTYGGVKGAQIGSGAAESGVKKVLEEGLQKTGADLASGAWQAAGQVKGAVSEYSSSAYEWSSVAASSALVLSGKAISSASAYLPLSKL